MFTLTIVKGHSLPVKMASAEICLQRLKSSDDPRKMFHLELDRLLDHHNFPREGSNITGLPRNVRDENLNV